MSYTAILKRSEFRVTPSPDQYSHVIQANILIDNSGAAVLCDFGLSRVRADVTSRGGLQNTEGGGGTLHWMSPELLLGGGLRKSSDIYAFGMVIYEVILMSNVVIAERLTVGLRLRS